MAGVVTCSAASYNSTITYQTASALSVNLNNPAMVLSAGFGSNAVSLTQTAASTGDLVLHVVSVNTVNSPANNFVVQGRNSGTAAIVIDAGTIGGATTYSAIVQQGGQGVASFTLNGGSLSSQLGVSVSNSGGGDARAIVTGGSLVTGGALSVSTVDGAASVLISGGSVTNTTVGGIAVQAAASFNGTGLVRMDGGSVKGLYGLSSQTYAGTAQTIVTGGAIGATNIGAEARANGPGSASLSMTGGAVTVAPTQTDGNGLRVVIAGSNSTRTASDSSLSMSGGSVTVTAAPGFGRVLGLYSENSSFGRSVLRMTGGTVTVSGLNSDGIFVRSTAPENLFGSPGSVFDVQVTGGTVTSGTGVAAALHTASDAGGTILIGAGAVLDGSSSGVAIRDGDANNDGVDETGGAAAITTAGTLKGAIVLGSGADTVKITGGSIAGDIRGSSAATVDFAPASGTFVYDAPYTIGGVGLVSASSGATAIAGTINADALAIRGGTLALTGTDLAGRTTISSGALTIDGTFTSTTTVLSGGALTVNGTLNPGAFTFAGGVLTVNGSLTSTQPMAVPGTLIVNGTLNIGITVQSGGKLGGNGTVGSVVVEGGGVVAPGNSIGLLHVNGAFSQAAGSVYQAEFDPNSAQADRIQVSGAATLAPGAVLTPIQYVPGLLVPGTRYTVLTAAGGLTGTYTLNSSISTAFLALKDSYDANDAYLDVVQTRPLSAAAQTPNQLALATTMATSGPVGVQLLNLSTDADARAAFDQLTPVGYAGVSGVLASDARLVREAALVRLRACQGPSAATADCPDPDRASAWAQDFGSWSRVGATSAVTGVRSAANGFLIGFDTPLPSDARIGAFAGYSRTRVTTDPGTANIDNFHVGVFGGARRGPLSLRADAAFSDNAVSAGRSVAFGTFADRLSARYDAHTAQIEGEAGYRLQGPAGVALEPFAGLAYIGVHTPDFSEQGGAAAVSVRAQDTDVSYGTIGVRPSFAFKAGEADITVQGLAGWRYADGALTPASIQAFAGGPSFTVQGAPLARSAGLAGVELGMRLAGRAALAVSYGGQFGGASIDQTVRATLAVRF